VKRILADLHIHTVLSPCAGEEMTPPAIVRAAVAKGLDMIAICDHNSAGNVRATQEAAGDDLAVLAGMEVTTAEEVHVLGLFPDAASAASAAEEVLATLPDQPGPAGAGERQWLMDAGGRVVGSEKKMLSAASTFTLDQAVELVKRHGGMAVASHVDRPSFSVMSQLGLFPREAGFDAIEVFSGAAKPDTSAKWAALGLPILRSSDSHYLAGIASRTTCLTMQEATFTHLRDAVRRGPGGPLGGA
jgi:predicted metal-dependent phosphoesterase TrpH